MSTLLEQVKSSFQQVISTFSLRVKGISENWVVLVNKDYAIGVILDRDGLSYMYYDRISDGKAYNLGLYLIRKRRDQLTFENNDKSLKPLDEYLKHNLDVFAGHLIIAGQDILSGEKRWIRDYSWPAIDVDKEVLVLEYDMN